MAVVVASLRALDSQLTAVAPRRTLPTWYLGDTAHRQHASGHNPDDTKGSKSENSDSDNVAEIRAGDYRLPLNATFTAEQFVQWLVKKCRSGEITWIQYIIFNKRIWSASSNWVTRAYTGANKHDHHFHVSSKSDTKSENTTKDMGMSALVRKPAVVKPREVKYMKLEVLVPDLHEGDDDDKLPSYNLIARMQKIVNVKADGVWGGKTTAGIAQWTGKPASQCKKLTEEIYRLVFGASKP